MIPSAVRLPGLLCALALAVLAVAWSPPAQAAPLQPGFTESVVFSGLTEPTDVAFAPDGRAFVAEKSGLIKVFPNLTATTPTVAADLRTQVYNFWDRGLLSIALDPQFPIRPYLYALYTRDAEIGGTAPRWGQAGATSDPCPTPPGPTDAGCVVSTRLAKLTLSGSVVTGEQALVSDWCQQFPSHSAGGLVFGPDGMLYASGGDGASFLNTDYGQDGEPLNPCGDPPVPVGGTQTPPTAEGGALRAQDFLSSSDPAGLDGSLIRIDPDTGAGASGNPMSASADANARRIVASGMRNPFRFTFRPGTPEIYVGDVGWGAWEEIDRLPRADDATVDNFGWPCYEGTGRSPAYEGAGLNLCKQLYNTPGSVTSPLFTYNHGGEVVTGEDCTAAGSSISGLAFYQGGNYPAAYSGALFFADYSRRCTWVMFEKNGQPDPATRAVFLNENDPVNIKIGPGGDLFLVDFNGSLRRISYPGGNRAPTAVALAQPQAGPLPLTVNFDGTGSSDPDAGDTLTYAWDLDGDGQYDDSTAAKPAWTYTSAATVTVRLRVTDKGGLSATGSVVIGAGNEPPHAQIDTPTAALHWAVGDSVSFSGGGSDPQQGTLGPGSMTWTLVMRHCVTLDDCHSHSIQSYPGVSEGKFTAPDHEYPSYLELRLTVTDSGGLSDTATLRLDPRTVDLTYRTEPPGLTLAVGQETAVAPLTRTVIVGSRNSVAAPTPQSLNGSRLGFASWSDGGARTHDIVAPATATTYTASYTPEPAPPGLVLAYGFEETSGTVANDASPAKNNGTVNGATGTAAGRFGRALSFDGVNDRVDVPDAASLELSSGLTLEAWVQPAGSRLHAPVITKETTSFYTYRLEAGGEVKGIPEGYISDGPWSWEDAEDTKELPVGSWSHLALAYDGENMRLYVNGNLVSVRAAAKPKVDGLKLLIGGFGTTFYEGLIDEVRVYNRALSAAEIGADMNAAIGSGAPGDTTAPSAPANLNATGSLGKVTLGWNASTDNVGVSGYEVYRSTTAGFTPAPANRIATTGAATGYVDTTAPGTYYYRVKATDAAGNLSAASAEASGTATADTTAPTVSLTAPAAGTVSGTVALKATAGDDVGVAGVQFLVDGNAFGAEDTSAPYEVQWPSTSVANGTHKISARARDAAGNATTSAEVAVTVSNAVSSGLVLAYGFEETSGTTVTDASPAKNNGTANGATQTAAGRFGRALSFDGVNDRVDVPDAASLDLTTGMTLEAWVRPTTNTGWRTALMKERGASLVYALYASNGVTPDTENFTGTENAATAPAGLALNTWTHLASTYDGSALRLFVNGTQVATKAAGGAMPNTANPLRIGGNAIWGEYFAGLIDEVRVYNRALSAAEIGADMNAAIGSGAPGDTTAPSAPANLNATGSLGKVTLGWNASTDNVGVSGYEVYRSTTAGFTPAPANRIATTGAATGYVDTTAPGTYYYRVKATDAAGNLSAASAEASGTATADTTAPTVSLTAPAAGTVSGTVALKATAGDDVGVAGVQFLVDGNAFGAEDTSAPYEVQWPSTSVANGTHKISARARDAAGNATTSAEVAVTVSNAVSSGLVLAYGFEETSGTTVTDASPAKNNGTANGATQTAAGRFGRALSFDGVNDRVDVPDAASLDLTTGMTLEAWVRPTTSRLHAPVITKETTSFYTYRLEAGGEVKGIPEGYISDGPWSWEDAEDTKALPNGSWSHLALTYDGATMMLYVNGKLVSTRSAAKPKVDGLKLLIGGFGTTFYEGLIDEVRVYNRALSAAEIGADMNAAVNP